MKKIILSALICAMSMAAAAQARIQAQEHYSLSFESRHGEAYTVYIDGDIVNRMPQGRVIVNEISHQVHEIIVVLRRPAEKAATIRFLPGEPNAIINVDYDAQGGYLHLYTAPCNRPDAPPATAMRPRPNAPVMAGERMEPASGDMPLRMVSDGEVDSMVVQLKAVPFDSDRMALARTLLSSALFSSAQIARLVQTIDYSNSQVELLKYAYSHCSDPRNYNRAIEVLAFSSDRRKVTDYLATQH